MRTPLTLLLLVASAPATPAQLRFVEATEQAGLAAAGRSSVGPLADFGDMGGGAAVLDLDRDGWPDLFVPGGGRVPDRLFQNRGDGTFEEIGEAAGVALQHGGMGATAADFDGDGWEDLYVTSVGPSWKPEVGRHLLYRNRGDGTFEECAAARGLATTSPGVPDGTGAAFADLDLDGDLDLVVGGWRHFPLPSRGTRLFLNDGTGHFQDATHLLPVTLETRVWMPSVCDMDGDGWPEVLLAADFSTSRYYVNHGGLAFEDRTSDAGVGLDEHGMGSVVADLDGDGRLDWYVTSIHDPDEWLPWEQTGNKLYWNEGAHHYREGAEAAGVHAGQWGWGVVAADLDHDGWVDLAEVNGFNALFETDPARLWRNLGGRRFEEVAQGVGFDHAQQGRALVDADFDRDGDRDLFVVNHRGEAQYYRNELGPSRWLAVRLDTSARSDLAPAGLGARVEARVGERVLVRARASGCGYLSRSEPTVHFGLGAAAEVDELRVLWPDGSSTVLRDVAANQHLTVTP